MLTWIKKYDIMWKYLITYFLNLLKTNEKLHFTTLIYILCAFSFKLKCQLILLFNLFFLLFIGHIALLVLFMGLTILFQLTFTFIYSTFINKFSVSAK